MAQNKQKGAFVAEDESLLTLFGKHCGAAMKNAMEHEEKINQQIRSSGLVAVVWKVI